ncbi:MAG TPA: O-antigen ligase family protein [Candidatus Eremiobacteraceae bacterium]|nr:O-antigen ligase family protein [Candidatus Eremiobacteraceae bacterium]
MHQISQVGLRRFPSALLPLGLSLAGVLAGVAIAQGWWAYLLMFTLAPFFWYFPVQTALGLFAFSIPFEGLSQLGGGTTAVWVLGLLAGGTLVAIGLLDDRLVRPPRTAIYWAFFLLWVGLSVLWAVEPKGALRQLATAAALVMFYFMAVSFRIAEKEFEWVTRLAIVGGCLAGMLALYQYSAGIAWETGMGASMVSRASLTVGENQVNPDFFGFKLIIPVSFALAAFLSARTRLGRFLSFCALGITVLALLLTMSRAAVLSLGVLLVVFFVRLRLYRRLMPVVLLAAILLASMPATFYRRIQEAGETGGAGRLDIWEAGLEMFKHYPLFGTGLGNFPIVYQQYAGFSRKFHGFTRSPHNIYLSILVDVGILGLGLFVMAVVRQARDVSQFRKNTGPPTVWVVAGEAAFYSLLVYGFFVDLIWDKAFWLAGIFLAFAIAVQAHKADVLTQASASSA